MAFGESSLFNIYEASKRFYNATALTETYLLKISRREYAKVVHTHAKRSLNEKIAFLKAIPNFNGGSIPRLKLTTLCMNLFSMIRVKNHVLYK
jgi:hypothetical protein